MAPETWGATSEPVPSGVTFVKDTGQPLSSFDVCFDLAQLSEQSIARILTITTIEAKDDLLCKHTGNVFIEVEYRGRPSGIMVTQATHWCIKVMEHRWVIVTVDDLRGLVRRAQARKSIVSGGDNGWSRGALIPVGWLTQVQGMAATPTQTWMPVYETTRTGT